MVILEYSHITQEYNGICFVLINHFRQPTKQIKAVCILWAISEVGVCCEDDHITHPVLLSTMHTRRQGNCTFHPYIYRSENSKYCIAQLSPHNCDKVSDWGAKCRSLLRFLTLVLCGSFNYLQLTYCVG